MEEQRGLLTTEPSFQPPEHIQILEEKKSHLIKLWYNTISKTNKIVPEEEKMLNEGKMDESGKEKQQEEK